MSLELQILQMIDVYSAMTMDHPYKQGVSAVVAIEKIITIHIDSPQDLFNKFSNLPDSNENA